METFAPYISPKLYPSQQSIPKAQSLYLLAKYRETGDENYRNQILTGNMRIILALCSRKEYQHPNILIHDLIQEACMGFLKGIELFKPEKAGRAGVATYAYNEARGAILDFIRESGYNIKVPDNCHRAYKSMMKRVHVEEQKEQTHISPDVLIADKYPYQQHGALAILTRSYADPETTHIAEGENHSYNRSDIQRILLAGNSLPEPQRSLFRAYFGLSKDDYQKLLKKNSFTEIQAQRIISGCINKIRKSVGHREDTEKRFVVKPKERIFAAATQVRLFL